MSCTRVLQCGQSGGGLCEAPTLCKHHRMVIYLFRFKLGMRHCASVNDASDVLNDGAVDCNVLFDVCGVFVVVECSLFLLFG